MKVVGPVASLSDTPGSIDSAAPLLGEHTDATLQSQLGLTMTELARLRADGVIGRRAP